MSDEPGMPVSPHGDSGPWEPREYRGRRLPDSDDTPAEGWTVLPSETRADGSQGPEARGLGLEAPGQPDYRHTIPRQPPVPGTGGDPGAPRSAAPLLRGLVPADGRGQRPGRGGRPGLDRPGRDSWADRQPATTAAQTMKIGIWGSPASGKSTYLAALQHATGNAPRSLGNWTLFARTEQAEELLIKWNQQLAEERKFPEPTALAAEAQLAWRFKGDLAGSRYQPPWRRLRRLPEPSAFDLDLIDVSGEVFGPSPTEKNVRMEIVNRTLDHLARARGLIFLFDPITELEQPTVVGYMNRTLTQLAGRVDREGRTAGRYLPHYVSVCVTKFDDPKLFRQACRNGFVNTGRDGIPRILDKHAELFFDALCEGRFWEETDERGSSGPKFVRAQLQKYFHPDRISYYVTSSIGFNLDSDGQFDPDLYSMVRQEEKDMRIIGPIEPINVLEPLVELHMKLRGRA